MTLTRRPTRLSRDPDRNDWSIHGDGEEIGRLYEDATATRPELAWFWSIIVMGPARHKVRTDGRAAKLKNPASPAVRREAEEDWGRR